MVYFFIPNLIGYGRIILLFAAFYVCFDSHLWFFVFYALSQLLDALDGHAARAFNQCTKFGAVLDQVTDRISTACLVVVLAQFYPSYINWFLISTGIDLASHYAHLYSSLTMGKDSHKSIDEKQNPLLRVYYTNRKVLFTLCFGNEAFFLLLYLLRFWAGPVVVVPIVSAHLTLVELGIWLVAPLAFLKQFMNFVQLLQAAADIAAVDEAERRTPKKK